MTMSVGSLASNRAAFLTRAPTRYGIRTQLQNGALCVRASDKSWEPAEEFGYSNADEFGSVRGRKSTASREVKSRQQSWPPKVPEPTDYGPRYGSELYSHSQQGPYGARDAVYPVDGSRHPQARSYSSLPQAGDRRSGENYSGDTEKMADAAARKRERLGKATEILSVLDKAPDKVKTPSFHVDEPVARRPGETNNGKVLAVLNRITTQSEFPPREADWRPRDRFVQRSPKTERWPSRDGIPLPDRKGKALEKKAKAAAKRDERESTMDEATYMKEDWRRGRIVWMVREIPRLNPTQTVKIMNSQIKWVGNRDVSIVITRLMESEHYIRAHRVLKWAFLRPWFELDFEVATKLADALAINGKVGRARDLYNLMLKSAYVPQRSTFAALIQGYLDDARLTYIDEAWRIYNKMITFGHYEPPASASYSMFNYLVEYGKTNRTWINRADTVFRNLRTANLACTTVMYESLITLQAVSGDEKRVNELVEDMRLTGVELSPVIFGALIRVSAKSGNYLKAEEIFKELREKEEPDWRYYVALIEAYGNAGLHQRAVELFQDIQASNICPLSLPYNAVIQVIAGANQIETAEKLLSEVKDGTVRLAIMQPAFNAVMDMYIRNGMCHKVEETLEEMKLRGCRPDNTSYNLLLKAYSELNELDKADKLYQKMLKRECLLPNVKTFEIMIGTYGKAQESEKLKEAFVKLTECKHPVPEEFRTYVDAAVDKSWVIQAEQFCQPRLALTERAMIVGALLGGAGIKFVNRRSFEIHFERDANSYRGQLLIKDLYDKFLGWAVDRPRVRPIQEEAETAEAASEDDELMERGRLHFNLMGHAKFKFYADQYRPAGFPKIPRLIHRWLNPVSLAYWYMYNGRRSTSCRGLILDTTQYPFIQVCLVGEALRGKSIHCSVRRNRERNHYLLVTNDSADWLWRQMEPYIIKELVPLLEPVDPSSAVANADGDVEVGAEEYAAAAAAAAAAARSEPEDCDLDSELEDSQEDSTTSTTRGRDSGDEYFDGDDDE